MLKKAMLYDVLGGGAVQCGLCAHRCTVEEGGSGRCGVRINNGGVLYSAVYRRGHNLASVDRVQQTSIPDHFLPGTSVYSIGGIRVHFKCCSARTGMSRQSTKRLVEAAGIRIYAGRSSAQRGIQRVQKHSVYLH